MSYGGRQQYGSYGREHGTGKNPPRRPWEAKNEEAADKKETAQYQNQKPQTAKQLPAHQARNSKYDEDDNKPDQEEKEAYAYYKPPSRQYYGGGSSSASSAVHNDDDDYYKPGGIRSTSANYKSAEQAGRKHSSTSDPPKAAGSSSSSKYTLTEEQMYPRSRPIQPYINNAEDDDEEEETGEDLVNELLTLSPRGQHVIPRKPGDPRRFGNTKIVVEDLHLFMDNNEIEDFQWNRRN